MQGKTVTTEAQSQGAPNPALPTLLSYLEIHRLALTLLNFTAATVQTLRTVSLKDILLHAPPHRLSLIIQTI